MMLDHTGTARPVILDRKGAAGLAACATLAWAGMVGAQPAPGPFTTPLYLQAVPNAAPAPVPAPTPRPLMALLDQIGAGKPLDNLGITLGGYVEGGYTASASAPPGNVIDGRIFDTKNEHVVLDQLDFSIDRAADVAKAVKNHTIDVGAHLDLIYGWDAGLIHSNGLFDNPATLGVAPGNGYYASRTDPENQFDITQAYVDLALPVGNGLTLRLGKFVTLLGYETINPTSNAFYSHSYLFGFAVPFTQTGVLGIYRINDDFSAALGVTRGWNQSLNDNNGVPDLLASVTYTPQENDELKKWKAVVNLSEGPQATHDNHDWWTVIDVDVNYAATPKLAFGLNADYGDAPYATGTGPGTSAQWYGVAGYAGYALNDYLTANARAEYYGDSKGFTLGVAGAQNLYEITGGVTIKPVPHHAVGQNLAIRPEIRFDYSDPRFFDAGTDHYQFTFGIDAYFQY